MNIVFSEHALRQIKLRRISKTLIKKTLLKPIVTRLQADGRLRIVFRFSQLRKNYVLIVVSEKQKNATKIITAFISSKIKKYL